MRQYLAIVRKERKFRKELMKKKEHEHDSTK
jgi:hypothetical protein